MTRLILPNHQQYRLRTTSKICRYALVPRLTLGTSVLVLPPRHPILVAKQAASLYLLSGGLLLCVAIGHRAAEFVLQGAAAVRQRTDDLDRGQHPGAPSDERLGTAAAGGPWSSP